ncbi:hypothetical protein [Nonomuraea sp. NPDC001699]
MSNPLLSGISGRPVVRRLAVPALTVVLALALGITPAGAASRRWVAAWGAAVQPATPSTSWYGPNWSEDGFARRGPETLRQIVRLGGGGTAVRVRLSNVHGAAPLAIDGAAVARADRGAATLRPRTLWHS